DGGGEAGVVERAAGQQLLELARGGSLREALARCPGIRTLALAVEAAETVEIVAADLDVHLAHLEVARQRDDLVLGGEHHAGAADRAGKLEELALAEALPEAVAPVPV